MKLENDLTDIPPGKVASIVTYLEMRAKPALRPAPELSVKVVRVEEPDAEWYRDLYRRVGAMDWLWFLRLQLPTAELESIIKHPDVEIYTLSIDGQDEGYAELDCRQRDECELAFFGVTRKLIGKGAGRLLMNEAVIQAWSRPIQRFWVHTCTLDHPAALPFYIRSGFIPYRQQVEIADDPRLAGLLPESAGLHIPIIR